MEDWKRDEGQEGKKEKNYVTRKEFYICFAILLAVIFWRSGAVESGLQQRVDASGRNVSQKLDNITSEIYSISDEVRDGVQKANSPLEEQSVEMISVDHKAKTVILRMKATPKEYQQGMGMAFFLSCDGAEPVIVSAEEEKGRVFTAEAEVPFCGEVAVTASVKQGNLEYLQLLDSVVVGNTVFPYFDAYWAGSVSTIAGMNGAVLDGSIDVYIQKPEWMRETGEPFSLKDAKTEVSVNGKTAATIQMVNEAEDAYTLHLYGFMEEAEKVLLQDGQDVEFLFYGTDNYGMKYTYIVEQGTWTKENGYVSKEPDSAADAVGDARLTVE